MTVQLGQRSYDIVAKPGALRHAGKLCNLARKVLVVTDSGVPQEYSAMLAAQCKIAHILTLPQGEGTKSAAAWQQVLCKMLELGFGRGDAVAAVGGGVIGDLAGFAASAYMRGITFFQFPTTTLSQIDSSIGGKVAINLAGTKNVVGAFFQPELVVVDTDTLKTLPKRHYNNGLVEALKAGLIGDKRLFDIFEKEDIDTNLETIIERSLLYKKGVVERDETEQGERKKLNFGHTIGHGIEGACGFGEGANGLLHGESVALGMLPMITSPALRKRTIKIMKKLGLPLAYNCTDEEILPYIQGDKKRKDDVISVVRVDKLGASYFEDLTIDEIGQLIKSAK